MSVFLKRLVRAVAERLDRQSFRYIDNSLAYYNNPIPENTVQDKQWFSEHRIPPAREFLREASKAILQEDKYKSWLYSQLADSHSREVLLLVSLYTLLGHRFVKLPYYGPDNIRLREDLRRSHAIADAAPLPASQSGLSYPLELYRFPVAGENVSCYSTAEFVYQCIYSPQYRYAHGTALVDAVEGDYVLDCGACAGDTAIYFAARVGQHGQVVSFEPHPKLQEIWKTNRQLNPRLAPHMHLMPVATSDTCGTAVFSLSGPGSHLGGANAFLQQISVQQVTLDEIVQRVGICRVNMIKMDIEGAELPTLQGAVGILQRYRPKLAVCLYHKPQDYLEIPKFLQSMNLGYRFFIEHHYVNKWETVLYATVE